MAKRSNISHGFILTLAIGLISTSAVNAEGRDRCAASISEMGYEVGAYTFERGGIFSNDRHVFGDIVCHVSVRGEIVKIERGSQTIAEDGIFGTGALFLRTEAERISAERIAEARRRRDQAIEAARIAYEATRQSEREAYSAKEQIERTNLENLLQSLREGRLDEAAVRHFEISPDILSELGEDEFFSTLHDRFLQEQEEARRTAEQEAQAEEARRAERERQRQLQRESAEASRRAEQRARESILGIPVESDAQIRATRDFPERDMLMVGQAMIRNIHSRGWSCDSVSSLMPFPFGGGVRLRCNNYRYTYESTDRGGRLVVELK